MQKMWYDLLAFCSTSAIGLMDEPPIYGPLRLIDCMAQIIRLGKESGFINNDAICNLERYIEENKLTCMYDESRFRDVLQEIALRLIAAAEK